MKSFEKTCHKEKKKKNQTLNERKPTELSQSEKQANLQQRMMRKEHKIGKQKKGKWDSRQILKVLYCI